MGKSKKEKKEKKDKKEKREKKDKGEKRGKKRKRSSSRSSSSSSDSDDDRKKRQLESKKAEKAKQKANETEEERKARRIAKKMNKMKKAEEEEKLFGYTNASNPFGDSNLTATFVWRKKIESDIKKGADPDEIKKQFSKDALVKRKAEIEAVKQRRKEREEEKAQMEVMKLQMERERDMEHVENWQQKEEEFHRKTAKQRSDIRIREGREKAIDILAKNLYLYTEKDAPAADISVDLDIELTEPYKIFQGLTYDELVELRKDLDTHKELGTSTEYWNALIVVCDDELVRQRVMQQPSASSSSKSGQTRQQLEQQKRVTVTNPYGLHPVVEKDIVELFKGKTTVQLASIEIDINKKLKSARDAIQAGRQSEDIDTDYWESLLRQLQIYKARAYLFEFHQELLVKRLKQLKRQKESEEQAIQERLRKEIEAELNEDYEPPLQPFDEEDEKEITSSSSSSSASAAGGAQHDDEGSYSPVLHQETEIDVKSVITAAEDAKELESKRLQVLEAKRKEQEEARKRKLDQQKKQAQDTAITGLNRFALTDQQLYDREAKAGMDEDEIQFGAKNEVSLPAPTGTYSWHDKYRPRKPRYFNRVKTGFEWNKYNQTHYDKENPPPKIVQGYKFNVFYPDLIDPTVPPKFRLEPDPTSHDYCIIRFIAGPPYEDIAFKIVKKEWEYAPKHGYRCTFDRGVLQLYFNFRRYWYRR